MKGMLDFFKEYCSLKTRQVKWKDFVASRVKGQDATFMVLKNEDEGKKRGDPNLCSKGEWIIENRIWWFGK